MSRRETGLMDERTPLMEIVTTSPSLRQPLIYDIVGVIAEFAEDHHVLHAMCLTHFMWREQVMQMDNYKKLKMVFSFFRDLPRDSVCMNVQKDCIFDADFSFIAFQPCAL